MVSSSNVTGVGWMRAAGVVLRCGRTMTRHDDVVCARAGRKSGADPAAVGRRVRWRALEKKGMLIR
jgi:hypothetical protein